MSRVADSSFLVALFDEDDHRHGSAWERAEDPDPVLVPPEVLTETLGVMQARYGHGVADGIWEGLGTIPTVVHLNSTRQENVAPVFREAGGALSWTDAAVVAHCLREDAEPLCFDDAIEETWRERAG